MVVRTHVWLLYRGRVRCCLLFGLGRYEILDMPQHALKAYKWYLKVSRNEASLPPAPHGTAPPGPPGPPDACSHIEPPRAEARTPTRAHCTGATACTAVAVARCKVRAKGAPSARTSARSSRRCGSTTRSTGSRSCDGLKVGAQRGVTDPSMGGIPSRQGTPSKYQAGTGTTRVPW
jgi:hypothetical protein